MATCRNFFGRQAAGLLCHFLRGLIGIVTPKEVGKVRKGTVDLITFFGFGCDLLILLGYNEALKQWIVG